MKKILFALFLIGSVAYGQVAMISGGVPEDGGDYPAVLDDGNTFAWYIADAEYLTTAGDTISQWDDVTTNNNDLTPSGSFYPEFSGDSVIFSVDDDLTATGTMNDTSTLYIVLSRTTWTAAVYVFDFGQYRDIGWSNSADKIRTRASQSAYINLTGFTNGPTYLLTLRFVYDGDMSLRINNGTATTVAESGISPIPSGIIFGDSDVEFSVKEFIIRDIADSSTDEGSIVTHLNDKYSIY